MNETFAPTQRTSPRHGKLLKCAGCGNAVDPLRAARVRLLRERFHYFCSVDCATHYDSASLTPIPQHRRPRPDRLSPLPIKATRVRSATELARHQKASQLGDVEGDDLNRLERHTPSQDHAVTQDSSMFGSASAVGPAAEGSGAAPQLERAIALADDPPAPSPEVAAVRDASPAGAEVGPLLLGLAMVASGLSIALLLLGDSSIAANARIVLAFAACGALVAAGALGHRLPGEPHPAAWLVAPIAATLAAIVAAVLENDSASTCATLSGTTVAAAALLRVLLDRARTQVEYERSRITRTLNVQGKRVIGQDVAATRADDLRPGEEIVVETKEVVPVDMTVAAGAAIVHPWLDAAQTEQRSEGQPVVAGAVVVQGTLRGVVGWSSHDRAWTRLTTDPRRRADFLAPAAQAGRLVAERAAPMGALLAGLTAFAANQPTLSIAVSAIAAQAALATPVIAELPGLSIARGVIRALKRGIVYRSVEALEAAGQTTLGIFCARGTLLLGEPEVASVEPLGDLDSEAVVALAAGAEAGATHPAGAAILRTARARSIRPDGARSQVYRPGLGVQAVAANGQKLVVGSRALMLQERISVAAAESKITDLEAVGRSALLVALGGRLVGVVGLQDGLRPGARAAVQHLLDARVEPVLLSGDARETSEAIGRTLDIEHIRPEVLPQDCGAEVKRLADGGATVSVIGRSPVDDSALSAADVAVALGSAGSTSAEWGIQLASDDVRDAAYALRLAHEVRHQSRLALVFSAGPGLLAGLGVAFGLLPAVAAPVAAAAGGIGALLKAKSTILR